MNQPAKLLCRLFSLLMLLHLHRCNYAPAKHDKARHAAPAAAQADLMISPGGGSRKQAVTWKVGDHDRTVRCCTTKEKVYIALIWTASADDHSRNKILAQKFNKRGTSCIEHEIVHVTLADGGIYSCLAYSSAVATSIVVSDQDYSSSTTTLPTSLSTTTEATELEEHYTMPSFADLKSVYSPATPKRQLQDLLGIKHVHLDEASLSAIRLSKAFIDLKLKYPMKYSHLYQPSEFSFCPDYPKGVINVTKGSYEGYELINSVPLWKCYLTLSFGKPKKCKDSHTLKVGKLGRVLLLEECSNAARIVILDGTRCLGDSDFLRNLKCNKPSYYQLE